MYFRIHCIQMPDSFVLALYKPAYPAPYWDLESNVNKYRSNVS